MLLIVNSHLTKTYTKAKLLAAVEPSGRKLHPVCRVRKNKSIGNSEITHSETTDTQPSCRMPACRMQHTALFVKAGSFLSFSGNPGRRHASTFSRIPTQKTDLTAGKAAHVRFTANQTNCRADRQHFRFIGNFA